MEKTKEKQRKAVGYIRVSTTMQSEDGISLDTQTKRIKEFCLTRNIRLKKVFSDAGISGGHTNRPSLQEMLEGLKEGYFIICAELSRLSRSTNDALNILQKIKEKGCFLISLSPDIDFSTPIGEMMYTILMAFHQLERKQIAERVSLNMKNLSKQNKLRSKPPFGFKFNSKDQSFEKDKEQQKIIKLIIKLYEEDGIRLSQISKYLNENSHNKCLSNNKKTKYDQIFYPETIKRILEDNGYIETNRKTIDQRFMDSRKNIES